jgi:CheY-like chemotaxis protein
MMPKMSGIEVLEKLKADEATKKIPVVMLTNLAGKQDAEAALAKGAVKYIIKSDYDPKQVAEMVKGILGGYKRRGESKVKEEEKGKEEEKKEEKKAEK